MPVEPPRAAGG